MQVVSIGYWIMVLIAVCEHSRNSVSILLLFGFVIGTHLCQRSGPTTLDEIKQRKNIILAAVLLCTIAASQDGVVAIKALVLCVICVYVADLFVTAYTLSICGNLHLDAYIMFLIGTFMCSESIACSYLLCGVMIGYGCFMIADIIMLDEAISRKG